jgi:hypothetical protein
MGKIPAIAGLFHWSQEMREIVDWMVAVAVCCERVSEPQADGNGKNNGIIAKITAIWTKIAQNPRPVGVLEDFRGKE